MLCGSLIYKSRKFQVLCLLYKFGPVIDGDRHVQKFIVYYNS